MNYKVTFLGLLFSLLLVKFSSGQITSNSKLDLYILIGQSNMAGRGVITEKFKNEGNARVLMLNKNNEWVYAQHPLHFDKPIAGVGPGLAFGLKMAEADPEVKIGLIPCAVGGSPIEHWSPGAYDEATKTYPYDDAAKRIKAAMPFGVIKGVIWHQGESNSGSEKATVYIDQLKELISRVRQLVNNPDLPFVAGELGRFYKEQKNINEQLQKLPPEVNNTAVVSSKKLTDKGDQLHFDASSAEELGKRYAKAMLKLQSRLKR